MIMPYVISGTVILLDVFRKVLLFSATAAGKAFSGGEKSSCPVQLL